MELEVETKITLKLAAEHYVHGRAMIKLDNPEAYKLAGWKDRAPATSSNILTAEGIKNIAHKALQEAFDIVSSEVLDELATNIEEIE